MDATDVQFYKTINKYATVFTTDDNGLNCLNAYVCNILGILIEQDKSVNYHLRYHKSEPGIRRQAFWKPY